VKNTFQQRKIVDSSKSGYAELQSDVKFLCHPPFSGEGEMARADVVPTKMIHVHVVPVKMILTHVVPVKNQNL